MKNLHNTDLIQELTKIIVQPCHISWYSEPSIGKIHTAKWGTVSTMCNLMSHRYHSLIVSVIKALAKYFFNLLYYAIIL